MGKKTLYIVVEFTVRIFTGIFFLKIRNEEKY